MRVKNDGRHADDHPWPGAESVVGDVEPERGEEGVALVLRAEHALRDVTAAAGFGPGIPGGPPVDGDVDEEGDRGHPDGMEIGNEAEERAAVAAELRLHGIDAADGAYDLDAENYNHRHLDGELKKIGDEH